MSRAIYLSLPLLCLALAAGAREHDRQDSGPEEERGANNPASQFRPNQAPPGQVKERPVHERRSGHYGLGQGQQREPEGRHLGRFPSGGATRQREEARAERPRVVPQHFQERGVRGLPGALKHGQRLDSDREHSVIELPKRGPLGRAVRGELLTREHMNQALVHDHLRAVVQDRVLVADLQRFNREEAISGHYYWHAWNGVSYCHYYDPWGYHWYGWYLGRSFFWCRYYRGTWWYYDPLFFRWNFWYDGFWWWEDPFGVVFIYDGSNYVSSDDKATPVPTPEATPEDIPALPTPPATTTPF
jgi:hypothetical protein